GGGSRSRGRWRRKSELGGGGYSVTFLARGEATSFAPRSIYHQRPRCRRNSWRRSSCMRGRPPHFCRYSLKSFTPRMYSSRKRRYVTSSRSASSHLRRCSSSEKYS